MDDLIDRLTCEEMVNAVGENDMFLEGPGLEWVVRYARCHGTDDGCGRSPKKDIFGMRCRAKQTDFSQLALPPPSISPPMGRRKIEIQPITVSCPYFSSPQPCSLCP